MEQQLYELLRQCTVRVSIPGKVGHGTGFFVASGLILTCAHVLKTAQPDTSQLEVYWSGQSYLARVTKLQQDQDLALLQMDLSDHYCVFLQEKVSPFDPLYCYGYPDDHPDGDPVTFIMEGKAGKQGEQLKFKVGQVRPGLSGAPLLNIKTGGVCGVVQLTRGRDNDLGGRAIPITTVFKEFPEIMDQQRFVHQHDKSWLNCLEGIKNRTKYLESVDRRYSSVRLPIGPAEGFSLQAIFQPLTLRLDPLTAEDLTQEERRRLLGERPSRYRSLIYEEIRQSSPIVIADNSNDALKKSPRGRMVVLGGPGTGKTTTLKYLIGERAKEALANFAVPIPIFISLPDLARSGKLFQRYLKDVVSDMGVEESYGDILWQFIDEGKAFLCLDSLDEVDPHQRPAMIELINTFASNSGNVWIIGSRFTEYKGGQFKRSQFAEWELLPMNQILRQELARRLFPELQRLLPHPHGISSSPSAFVNNLENHAQAAAWGENPLLFSLAGMVFVRNGALPSGRASLYYEVIDAILKTREQDQTRQDILFNVIADVALELYKMKGRTFTVSDLLHILPDTRARQSENWSTEDISNRIIASGIIEVVAYKTYGFRHQTFQEYLAAVELAQRLVSQDATTSEGAWQLAWSKRMYSRWTEILRLMIGILVQNHGKKGIQRALQWLNEIVGQRWTKDGDLGNLGLALAIKSLGEIAVVSECWVKEGGKEFEGKIVRIWVNELLHTAKVRDFRTRQRRLNLENLAHSVRNLTNNTVDIAVNLLVFALLNKQEISAIDVKGTLSILGERTVEPLSQILVHSDPNIRVSAIETFGSLGKHAIIEPLVLALNDSIPFVRAAAVEALGQLGERTPVDPLIQAVSDKAREVRIEAVRALGGLGEHAPVENLNLILNDIDPSMRAAAIRGLAKLEKRTPMHSLIAALNDDYTEVRIASIEALGQLSDYYPLNHLIPLIGDGDPLVRKAAVEALGKLDKSIPVEQLILALRDNNEHVRQEAARALERLGAHAPAEPLIEALSDENRDVRMAAARALGGRISTDQLLNVLGNTNVQTREVAIQVLGKLFKDPPIDLLVLSLRSPHKLVRKAAIEIICELGETSHIEDLIELLICEEGDMRAAVTNALGFLGKKMPVDQLTRMLSDNNSEVRRAAIGALGKVGRRMPVDQLTRMLSDSIVAVRIEAIKVLGKYTSIEQLITCLKDEDESVREATVKILEQRAKDIPVEPLVVALNDEYEGVRARVVRVLGILGEQAPIEPLTTALRDNSWWVRATAAWTLHKLGIRAPIELLMTTAIMDDEVMVRRAAWSTLSTIGVDPIIGAKEVNSIDPIIDTLGDFQSYMNLALIQNRKKLKKQKSVNWMVAALNSGELSLSRLGAELLSTLGKRIPVEPLIATLGSNDPDFRKTVIQILQRVSVDALWEVRLEAVAVLQGQAPGPIFSSLVQGDIADIIGNMGQVSPILVQKLVELLDWPYWEVREKAANALGRLRRNIPDIAIQHLQELRRDPQSRAVRIAAEGALAEILSLETGIEDD